MCPLQRVFGGAPSGGLQPGGYVSIATTFSNAQWSFDLKVCYAKDEDESKERCNQMDSKYLDGIMRRQSKR